MRTVTWLCRFMVLVGVLVTITQPVEAQRRRSANNEQQQKARTAYARGQELFQGGQFEPARAAFTEAFDAVPNPVVLLSVAECEVKLSLLPEAVTTLERYLALREDAPDRAQIEAKITAIKEMPATVVVSSDTPGARISIDGADTGKVTPAELQVTPGDHTIVVAFTGEEGVTQTLTARYGQRHELSVELGGRALVDPFGDAPAPAAEPAAAPVEAKASSSGAGPAAWVLASIGAVGIVTGTVLGFMALSAKNDFDKPELRTAKLADKGERLALFTDVAFGVGAVCLITGLVLAVTAGEEEAAADAEANESARLRITPVVSPTTAAISAQLQF